MIKISCTLLVLVLLGSCYAQYQYPQQRPDAGGAAGGIPASPGSPGGVDNRIIGLGGLLGGGGGGGGLLGGGGGGGLFGNLLGGLLGGGRQPLGQAYPPPVPSYGGGYPGYGYGGALGPGYAGGFPGNNFGGGFGPGYGNYYG
ncbi:eggshell protein 1 [Drosophila virilis]|uniref:Uncharacterized protein n=1 Tax=Drosophila virilis TaxID=7244 RepID=B4LZQ0_DROVI|nr:glycine-rich protein 23 [Drosophila virilis]EDW68219.1 uncharacterized protein Dvir_GJ22661 [Drosophila virilis]